MRRRSARNWAEALRAATTSGTVSQKRQIVRSFLQVLIRQRGRKLLPRIIDQLEFLADQKTGRQRVQVTTATQSAGEALVKVLKKSSKTMTVEQYVEPSLKGGVVIRVGDYQIDSSIASQLQHLYHQLTA